MLEQRRKRIIGCTAALDNGGAIDQVTIGFERSLSSPLMIR